jgi:hypothetical protein
MPPVELPSIHDLAPLEQGGPIARTGFKYQDHVAARFCIEMLRNPKLTAVWCETLDDITLLWSAPGGGVTVEFVQVKSNELEQMWSIALICDGGKKSLVAHSLAQHRCHEPCCFRIVTRVGLMAELRVLALERDHKDRCVANAVVRNLHQELEKRLNSFCSNAGWSPSAWVGNTLWDVAESEDAIRASNLLELEQWLEDIEEMLFIDQRGELYSHILGRVVRASALKHQYADKKKLLRDPYGAWVMSEVNRLKGQAPSKSGKILTGKMETAQIDISVIQNALSLRLAYRRRTITPKYQQEDDYKNAEMELTAVLQGLVAKLDAGLIGMDGPAFHAKCLDVAEGVRTQFPNVDLSFLYGSMYSMTDRCRHRFVPTGVP